MNKQTVLNICNVFNIHPQNISDVIETSRSSEDIRYNYIIDKSYVLKINTAEMINEKFLTDINRLVEKYRNIGVWCPKIIKSKNDTYLYTFMENEKVYRCYVEEYAPYATAGENTDEYKLKKEMMWHLGKLASEYTDKDLASVRSMWSIIDLAPLDTDVDEKQENLDDLVSFLREKGYNYEAEKLDMLNETARAEIKKCFDVLPRCVYQGDLNLSNILTDDNGHFKGIIDFNMFGTEVNINCFLNESMYYISEEDFKELSANEIYDKMNRRQKEYLDEIFRYYQMNETERKCFIPYRTIINISSYPNVTAWKYLIDNRRYEEKVIQLINLLCDEGSNK